MKSVSRLFTLSVLFMLTVQSLDQLAMWRRSSLLLSYFQNSYISASYSCPDARHQRRPGVFFHGRCPECLGSCLQSRRRHHVGVPGGWWRHHHGRPEATGTGVMENVVGWSGITRSDNVCQVRFISVCQPDNLAVYKHYVQYVQFQ